MCNIVMMVREEMSGFKIDSFKTFSRSEVIFEITYKAMLNV